MGHCSSSLNYNQAYRRVRQDHCPSCVSLLYTPTSPRSTRYTRRPLFLVETWLQEALLFVFVPYVQRPKHYFQAPSVTSPLASWMIATI